MFFFFFLADDGIRDGHVTGVQTCALPICLERKPSSWGASIPDGMGTTYKILVQHKGMLAPQLDGLRSRPYFLDALGVPERSEERRVGNECQRAELSELSHDDARYSSGQSI